MAWGVRDNAGNLGRADTLGELLNGKGAQDDPNLLHAAGENAGEYFPISGFDLNAQWTAAHDHSMGQNIST